jgi:hypothetical protein
VLGASALVASVATPTRVSTALAPRFASARDKVLRVILVYGQSLAFGNTGVSTAFPPLNVTPRAGADFLMLPPRIGAYPEGGLSPFRNQQYGTTKAADFVGDLQAAFEQSNGTPGINNETICTALVLTYRRHLPVGSRFAAIVGGRGGTPIAELARGGDPYTNLMQCLTALRDKAQGQFPGTSVQVDAVAWLHGEADLAATEAHYLAAERRLFSDLKADIEAITGQTAPIWFVVGQPAFLNGGSVIGPSLAKVTHAATASNVLCAGPQYAWGDYVDNAHPVPAAYVWGGCAFGHVLAEAATGANKPLLHAVSATRADNRIFVKFNVPRGALRLSPAISDPGFLGLRYTDDASSARVVGAKIVKSDTVRLTLSAVPTGGNPRVGIADFGVGNPGRASGARSPLCDGTQRTHAFTGESIPNYACMQRIAVRA